MPPVQHIPPGPDTIRVLLTTDNHVGYLENDPVRGDDSWKTFQEITQLAKHHDVDMIVQGGDLFHVTKPSKKLLYHVIQALRLNCLGDRPCELELLSDPSAALRHGDHVNYEDTNMNVAVPVFAISGNHDDATGEGLLLPLDVLAATGLINFFGQVPQLDKITVTPLVFQKGVTKLALYGINNMRDERMQRIMRNGDVTFQRPRGTDCFNLLCVHQNHFRHTMTSYVPEDFLPSFIDFVLWGHEHECIPFPQYNPTTGFDTLQPGSSVATSLSEGEAAPKHVFLLDIRGKEYAITPLPLQSVRPFMMRDVSLQKENFVEGPASKADINTFLVEQVEELIQEATTDSPEPVLPLVRLRVDHSGDYEVENARRFSNKFVGKIANVNDILLYHKRKSAKKEPERKLPESRAETDTLKVSIQQILKEHLGESNLYLLPEDGMFDVTKRFIEQDDKQIFTDYVEKSISNATQLLLDVNIDEEDFHLGDDTTVQKSFRQLLNKLRYDSKRKPIANDLELEPVPSPKTTKATKPTKPKARSAEKVSKQDLLSDFEDDIEVIPQPKPRSRKRANDSPELVEVVSDMEIESDHEKPKPRARKAAPRAAPKAKPKPKARATKSKSEQSLLDDILDLGG